AAPHILTIKVGCKQIKDIHKGSDGIANLTVSDRDDLAISISGFSYLNSWRNRFQYRLTGKDSTFVWIPLGENVISLNHLAMGKYKLEVRAANADGFWGAPRVVAKVTVYPFIATCATIGAILLLIGGVVFIYIKKGKKNSATLVDSGDNKKIKRESKDMSSAVIKEITDSSLKLMAELDDLMEKEELYLNKRLNKAQLAAYLKLSEQQLTQILKENKQKGFPDYVNSYRIEAVKRKMEEPRYKDFTLWAIGEECGFNSKTSFYRVFKEATGTTPAEYLEKTQNK
ncbi:MAG: helix-turn-helix domain-containing protein, partial [Bacteroidales bacterium]